MIRNGSDELSDHFDRIIVCGKISSTFEVLTSVANQHSTLDKLERLYINNSYSIQYVHQPLILNILRSFSILDVRYKHTAIHATFAINQTVHAFGGI